MTFVKLFSATLAHSDPDSIINLLDDPFGLDRARKTIESVGLDRQVNYITGDPSGDVTKIPELVDQTFDLVLLVGQIHRQTQQQCLAQFSQLHALVKPERELAVVDVFPGQESGETPRSIFELELGLRSSEGQLHDPKWINEALKESGFDQVQFAHLPSPPFYWGLVLAERN